MRFSYVNNLLIPSKTKLGNQRGHKRVSLFATYYGIEPEESPGKSLEASQDQNIDRSTFNADLYVKARVHS